MTMTDRETAAAQDDYLNLFAAYDNLKRDYAALQRNTDSAIDTLKEERLTMFGVLVRAQQSLEQYGFDIPAVEAATIPESFCCESYGEISAVIEAVGIPFDNDIYADRFRIGKE